MFIRDGNLRKKLGMGRLFNADTGADGGTGTGADNGNDEGVEDGGQDKETGEKTFDDVLKDKKYQSEFDKRIAKAIETAKGNWEADNQTKIEEAKTEAEKMAKMNAEQKAEYENNKKLEALEKREKEITTRELKAQAYETLAEKGLPKGLIEILNYESAETCSSSIEAVEKAFQSAVEKAVNDKLRGDGPPKGGGDNSTPGFDFGFTGVRSKSNK